MNELRGEDAATNIITTGMNHETSIPPLKYQARKFHVPVQVSSTNKQQ